MANIQKYFEAFNDQIKTGYNYNSELKDKRDTLLSNLRDSLDVSFDNFNQGSYGMGTGVKPEDGDFDIDVALVFKESDNEKFDSPFELKKDIYHALEHTHRTVKIKRPCVTVKYSSSGKDKYHVDFAIYRKDKEGNLYFARGKSKDEAEWEDADPQGLVNKIKNRFSNNSEKEQYKRCIRALKRWKATKLNHKNLPSIAITVAAYLAFEPKFYDSEKEQPNDVEALICFIDKLDDYISNKNLMLPVKPHGNLLCNLTDSQTQELRSKLKRLKDDLLATKDINIRVVDACKKMKKHFGKDFPIPEGVSLSTEQFIEDMFVLSKKLSPLSISLEISQYGSLIYSVISRFDRELKIIPKGRTLTFKIDNVKDFTGCDFYWKVLNIGEEAEKRGIRGQIEKGSFFHKEHSDFSGEHYVECYVIQDGICIARETIDVPI